MDKAILQIPISKTLRDRAVRNVTAQGFSSLQEMVRIFLHKLAKNQIQFGFFEPAVELSEENERRYDKMIKEIETGKVKAKRFSDVNLLIKELEK